MQLACGALLKDGHSSSGAGAHVSIAELLLEHFASYLRFHPNPKNIFKVFVVRLLEPSLELLVLLHLRAGGGKHTQGVLLRRVEDVLSNGLFHPVHMTGFFSLRTPGAKQEEKESRGVKESYHRHLFDKLEMIISQKKATALGGFGYLLRIFASVVKDQKGSPLSLKNERPLLNIDEVSKDAHEATRPLFEVFMQFMEPLLLECRRCADREFVESGEEFELRLVEAHCMLKSMNETFASFIQEKIYIPMEDTSEEAHYNFLKEVFRNIISISEKLYVVWLKVLGMDSGGVKKMLSLIAREVVVAVRYFLEIEYKVVGEDMVKLWTMMFSYLSAYALSDKNNHFSLLTTDIVDLGCKLMNVYSELRQVDNPIFAMCKAVRLFGVEVGDSELVSPTFVSKYLSQDVWLKSVATLLCSQDFRFSISSAIKSIPEGQASGFIQQLKVDITDSLEWMKANSFTSGGKFMGEGDNPDLGMLDAYLQAEILGKCLCEIYTIVLDSITITATNSVLIGNSIKNLMQTMRPGFSILLQTHSNSVDGFFSVIGRKSPNQENPDCQRGVGTTVPGFLWIFVFYFRMYVSSRSLYRQSISLMPPGPAKKASIAMGSSFTVFCGMDWTERSESMDEGYFSWIVKSSISLLDVIEFLSENFISKKCSGYYTLVYVLHLMALQRLNDLNRHIKTFEFLHERDERLVQLPFLDATDTQNSNRNSKELLTASRFEAAELTNFLTGYLPLLISKEDHISTDADVASEIKQTLPADKCAWDLGTCSLNENSLPTALWWLLCQNSDTWCVHATTKNLKKFLSHLLHYMLQFGITSTKIRDESTCGSFCPKITMGNISLRFLGDAAFYEQAVLYKHFTSVLCSTLKKSLSALMSHLLARENNLSSLPHWPEILLIFEKRTTHDNVDRDALHGKLLSAPRLFLSNDHRVNHSEEQSLSSFSVDLRTCKGVLSFLSKMVRVSPDDESLLLYTTYVIKLERLMVSSLLSDRNGSSICNPRDLLSAFNSCRRVMKYLVMASVEGNPGAKTSLLLSEIFNCSSSFSWILKSVSEIVGLPHAVFGEENKEKLREIIFSLIDHTSCVFFMISKSAITLQIKNKAKSSDQDKLVEADQYSDSSKHIDAWRNVELVADMLNEQIKSLRDIMNNSVHLTNLESCRLSSTVASVQGFLWGLVAGLDDFLDCSSENLSLSAFLPVSKLAKYIAAFEDFVILGLSVLIKDDHEKILCFVDKLPDIDSDNDILSTVPLDGEIEVPCNEVNHLSGGDHSKISSKSKRRSSRVSVIDTVLSEFRKIELSKLRNVKGPFLQELLKGERSLIAFSFRELFLASAGILKLKCMLSSSRNLRMLVDHNQFASSSMGILLGISHLALLEMAEMVSKPDTFSFVWLDGILKFVEVVGSNISLIDPQLSKDVFALLIDIHLRSIGRCISLQGKSATLSSHDTGSNIKMLLSPNGYTGNDMLLIQHRNHGIDNFKARLRMSFNKLIRKPHKLHMEMVMKALEAALIGMRKECGMVYEIHTGNVDGGEISSTVASGIECFDLVLESVIGMKHDFERHIHSLIGAIFNIVLHLQSPAIFNSRKLKRSEVNPDAGSIILMCIEVLTKIAGRKVAKKDSFDLDPCHVSQCLHIPMTLFQNFHQIGGYHCAFISSIFSGNQEPRSITNMHDCIVDRQFSVDLYASCCRLLCTTLKHKKRKVKRCIALLEDSVTALLCCLETGNADLLGIEGSFTWEVHEAVKCASFLRRIYEEIRHQKDVLGTYSSYFLSTYISICSGYGPLKTGIKRDIDQALRPGVYSLIDICTPTDLQQLHTELGEGPRRSTLATLLHDYRLNFQYGGKI